MSPTAYAPLLGGAAALIAFGTFTVYLASIPRGKVPARPVGSVVLQVLALLAAIAALIVATRVAGTSLGATIAPSATAMVLSGLFLYLLSQRKTPVGKLAVAVGDTLLPFTSKDQRGAPFDSASLDGKRVLLKFFRGHW
ncbi:MAG: hypothetical protein KC503_08525 [Myxococcales bacterium]|nr:hypothetical protein [Myxococcales bacterium]